LKSRNRGDAAFGLRAPFPRSAPASRRGDAAPADRHGAIRGNPRGLGLRQGL